VKTIPGLMREAIAIVEGNTKREGSLIWHNISGSGVNTARRVAP